MVTQSAGRQAMGSVDGDFRNLGATVENKKSIFPHIRRVPKRREKVFSPKMKIIKGADIAARRDREFFTGAFMDTGMRQAQWFIDKTPGAVIAFAGIMLALAPGAIDKATGGGASLSFLYLLPVLLISWKFSGRMPAVLMWLFCSLAWLVAGSHAAGPAWNTIMGPGILLATAYSFSSLKNVLHRERGLARIDYLTEVSNTRDFYEKAEIEFARSARYGRPLSIVVVDVDNFKYVNDHFGHSSGDQLLRTAAGTILKTLRKTDTVARIGGDEFAILLPETESDAAVVAVNKVRDHLFSAMQKNGWPVTFSVGIITRVKTQCTLANLMEMADGLMYKAKKNGKNLVLTGKC